MTTPSPLKYYRHRYGGIYSVQVPKAISTVDKSLWVVYTHAYPFEYQVWVRPYDEWCEEGKFTEISGEELYKVFHRDREELKREILEAKANSKRDK